jgi:hypothetical protein
VTSLLGSSDLPELLPHRTHKAAKVAGLLQQRYLQLLTALNFWLTTRNCSSTHTHDFMTTTGMR